MPLQQSYLLSEWGFDMTTGFLESDVGMKASIQRMIKRYHPSRAFRDFSALVLWIYALSLMENTQIGTVALMRELFAPLPQLMALALVVGAWWILVSDHKTIQHYLWGILPQLVYSAFAVTWWANSVRQGNYFAAISWQLHFLMSMMLILFAWREAQVGYPLGTNTE